MVRPIVPDAYSMAQNAHFGDSIGHRGITWPPTIPAALRALLTPKADHAAA
jgi:hypothetical protein